MIYAIGDVHGRADLLLPLLGAIERHAKSRGHHYRIVFLGDIIDRGPDSKAALDTVCSTLESISGSSLILGNHEEMLLKIIDSDGADRDIRYRHWLRNGGLASLYSYGFLGYEDADLFADEFADKFRDHLEVMRNSQNLITYGKYVLVHAGLRPGVPLVAQSGQDLRWIRSEFLDHDEPFEKFVIHGHTPVATADLRLHRLNIDTGAAVSGHLTAVAISPDGLQTLTTVEKGISISDMMPAGPP